MILHFTDGHQETLEFTPGPPPEGPAQISDARLKLVRAMKEGVLRIGLEDSDLIVFTSAVAFIELKPPAPEEGTMPWRFVRVKSE
jgi:hypothetical protein